MPTTTLNGTEYAYIDRGSGPLMLFGHGLLASKEMFAAQIEALADRYRCISVDWPGHADSGYDAGGWSFYDMADDATALVAELGYETAIFAGLSQGGMVFMRLAMDKPELFDALILLDTSSGPENAETLPAYEQLRELMHKGSDEEREQAVMGASAVLYGEPFRGDEGFAHERELMLAHDRDGMNLACRAVFDRDDVTSRLREIKDVPTLVIVGELDAATPPEQAQVLVDGIEGAELVSIPASGHHSPIENPAATTEAIEAFLAKL